MAILIATAHMLGDLWACFPREYLKKSNLVRFNVNLYTILAPPPTSFFACYMRPSQVSFLAYYMGAPSNRFLYTYFMGALQISFFAHYLGVPP